MNSILRQICFLLILPAILAALCLPLAILQQQQNLASGLALTSIISAFISLILLSSTKHNHNNLTAKRRDRLILVLLFWILTPTLTCLPFLTSGISSSFANALFEAVSNLSTTGSSIGPDQQPDAILLWRVCLQWLGGSIHTAIAVSIFAEFDSSAAGNIHQKTPYAIGLRVFFPSIMLCGSIYLVTAIITTLNLYINGTPALLAAEAAMALTTTSNSLSGTIPNHQNIPIIPALALLVGCLNIKSLAAIGTDKHHAWKHDPENKTFILSALITGMILVLLINKPNTHILFETLSFMASSGISLSQTEILPQPVPECLALIGGCALSTAGGLKIIRILALSNKVRRDIHKLSYANTASRAKTDKNPASAGAFIYLSAFISATSILMLCLAADGINTITAGRAAIGMLTNTGPLLNDALSTENTSLFSLGCILGRVEILAIAPLLSRNS